MDAGTPPAATTPGTVETADSNATGAGLYGLAAPSLEGETMDLSAFEGQVTLVVNVASKCGYTRQYEGLQELHAQLEGRGFAVLAFPSNEFGGQEPGSAAEIRQFCSDRYDVSFPMFAKSEVKGANQSPVYSFLEQQTGQVPSWNFCKYLVGKDGQVIAFYKSSVEPTADELRKAIETALG
ncbi:MAG: glutathione peroxidase [Planctomycetota bacterium]